MKNKSIKQMLCEAMLLSGTKNRSEIYDFLYELNYDMAGASLYEVLALTSDENLTEVIVEEILSHIKELSYKTEGGGQDVRNLLQVCNHTI